MLRSRWIKAVAVLSGFLGILFVLDLFTFAEFVSETGVVEERIYTTGALKDGTIAPLLKFVIRTDDGTRYCISTFGITIVTNIRVGQRVTFSGEKGILKGDVIPLTYAELTALRED